MIDLKQFTETYHDMSERLANALNIAGPMIGKGWSWTGNFHIENDMVEAEMNAIWCGDEELEQVSFPLEWLWTGGPDGDLEVTFRKGNEYRKTSERNKVLAKTKLAEDQEKSELARLLLKYGSDQ